MPRLGVWVSERWVGLELFYRNEEGRRGGLGKSVVVRYHSVVIGAAIIQLKTFVNRRQPWGWLVGGRPRPALPPAAPGYNSAKGICTLGRQIRNGHSLQIPLQQGWHHLLHIPAGFCLPISGSPDKCRWVLVENEGCHIESSVWLELGGRRSKCST